MGRSPSSPPHSAASFPLLDGDRDGDGLRRRGKGEAGSGDLDRVALGRRGGDGATSTAGECRKGKGDGSEAEQPKCDGVGPFATEAGEKSADCWELEGKGCYGVYR